MAYVDAFENIACIFTTQSYNNFFNSDKIVRVMYLSFFYYNFCLAITGEIIFTYSVKTYLRKSIKYCKIAV